MHYPSKIGRAQILILILAGVAAVYFFTTGPKRIDFTDYPSLRPTPDHTVAIRFDPSFYYEGRPRPKKLARRLAEKWRKAGVNTVFYRAYDPRHGAFYKTDYRYNKEGDFGRHGLMEALLAACRDHDIRVFAWFPVMNHAGAWEAHPQWRTRTPDGSDYRATGLEYPLCARNPDARRWWTGFLTDFLETYPGIDGVDLGEPVVAWTKRAGCACDLCRKAMDLSSEPAVQVRAHSLTTLIGDSVAGIRRFDKPVSVTTVQPAHADGRLLSSAELSAITGFDLTHVLHAPENRRPDIICPEFIWQELKSRHGPETDSPFDPAWTETAVRQFIRQLDAPVDLLVHVEITDFPGATVDHGDLEKTLAAARRGGARGIDVYNAAIMDEKAAWPALLDYNRTVPVKRCLVLHDPGSDRNDAIQIGELLRHFNTTIDLLPTTDYTPSLSDRFDAVFYVGTHDGASIPSDLVHDLSQGGQPVCWMGFNIQAVLDTPGIAESLGMTFVGNDNGHYPATRYKNRVLPKKAPWTTLVDITEPARCRVFATAHQGEAPDPDIPESIPYAVRSGRHFWYFADVPTSHAVEGDRFLIFADLLHDILDEPHEPRRTALVRIEDVHPLSDPRPLSAIAQFLYDHDVPFHIALVPFYVYPEQNRYVGLSERPELAKTIRHMVKKGGAVVMHGTTHQRFAETTADYEFWDPVANRPPEGENAETIRSRIEMGLQELMKVDIYPLMWETPHYAGSRRLYDAASDHFSLAMERRQSLDRLGTDQYFPYLIEPDRFGQIIVPENLGYIPLSNPDPEVILAPARNMAVVRDGTASFFFHPFVDMDVLKTIVRTLQKEGWTFTTAADLPILTRSEKGVWTTRSGKIMPPAGEVVERRMAYPGVPKAARPLPRSKTDEPREITLSVAPNEIVALQQVPPSEDAGAAAETSTAAAVQDLQTVANFFGEACQVPRPLIIDGDGDGADAMARLLELVGVSAARVDVHRFRAVPQDINLVLSPSGSTAVMTDHQVREITDRLARGDISLIVEGFGPLSDAVGIEKRADLPMTVEEVEDARYPLVQIEPPSPLAAWAFEAPADAAFLYEDRASGRPLAATARHGQGRYLFMSAAAGDPFGGETYPYLLSHIFRSLRMFPLMRAAGATVYFNPAERPDIAIENLTRHWRRSGVRTIYAAAWQAFPEWTYDYARLIRLAHAKGMRVYAWIEPPHVHDRFWLAHPECREKTATGRDAVMGWRKPMAMGTPDCFDAAAAEFRSFLTHYDWDGVLVNRAGWESKNGPDDPEHHTPFHPWVRSAFKTESGVDPVDLFPPSDHEPQADSRSAFRTFRETLAREWLDKLMNDLVELASAPERDWEIVVGHSPDRPHNGLSSEDIAALKTRFGEQVSLQYLQNIDGGDAMWRTAGPPFDITGFEMGPTPDDAPFVARAPTAYPTGTAFYEQLHAFIHDNDRFTLRSEIAVYDVDKEILPFLYASVNKSEWSSEGLTVTAGATAEIVLADSDAEEWLIDGEAAGSFSGNTLVLPTGRHRIHPDAGIRPPTPNRSETRLIDLSDDLVTSVVTSKGIDIEYDAPRRAFLVVNERPLSARIDGQPVESLPDRGLPGWAVTGPPGRHTLSVQARTGTDLILSVLSLSVSGGIVIISFFAILGLIIIGILRR